MGKDDGYRRLDGRVPFALRNFGGTVFKRCRRQKKEIQNEEVINKTRIKDINKRRFEVV